MSAGSKIVAGVAHKSIARCHSLGLGDGTGGVDTLPVPQPRVQAAQLLLVTLHR